MACPYYAPARSKGPALNSQTLRQFLGLLLLMFSVSLVPACAIATLGQENGTLAWLILAGVTATSGLMLWSPGRHTPMQLRTRDGFLVVAGFWILLSLLDALPLYILLPIHFVDALFESISGFTTTGATVLAGLDGLPHALLYYRQQLQWIGGIGMIVSAVAVLPLIGVGGMQLLRAETSGPMKDDKLAPRISKTARYLWSIYGGLTLLCALAYLLAGMTPFNAVCHAMTTLPTGGFSTHDANLAYFHSDSVDLIACFFMMLGSVPFTLHYLSLHNRSFRPYRQHAETKIFFGIVLLAIGLTWALIRSSGLLQGLEAWRAAAFAVISAITNRFHGRGFHALAVRAASAAYLPELSRRLCGFHCGRNQDRALYCARSPGGAGGSTPGAPEPGADAEARRALAAAASLGCRLGVLFCLRTVLRAADGDLSHERARLHLSLRCSCDHAE